MAAQHVVYVGLGSNLGERLVNLEQGIQRLGSFSSVEKISSCYETAPVGYLDQPDFLNMVAALTTELPPHELLRQMKLIEDQMGRKASFRNAPRPIDIDILLYDDIVLESPDLVIPHPRMAERAFVLVPLAEIAPDIVHPVLHERVADLLQKVDRNGVRRFSTD